ncbi:hypothetical protein EON65_29415 [archaeon]|nr:MAG: hypothetical protein EON65_29415 [archaeon]
MIRFVESEEEELLVLVVKLGMKFSAHVVYYSVMFGATVAVAYAANKYGTSSDEDKRHMLVSIQYVNDYSSIWITMFITPFPHISNTGGEVQKRQQVSRPEKTRHASVFRQNEGS